ncbi:MAG: di-trans,poly-cis-decaprenylcistransferase [Nitrospinae bacterium]|nr:di-trans,poly-cis-decaprenylcistransferase [Nitrospinota bacterium]
MESDIKDIDSSRLPKHVGIIMDGNGRWAKRKSLPRISGHRAGVKAVQSAVEFARKIGISALTLYSFSSENWNRPKREIDSLMDILSEFLEKELNRMLAEGIRFNCIGQIEDLPDFVQRIILRSIDETADRNDMVLTLALSYSGRMEITNAAKSIAKKVSVGEITISEIDESTIQEHLYTADLPELDLLIRTGGDLRLSNYMLWQVAYAELFFTELSWPDFTDLEFQKAILAFQKRIRKFGLTEEQLLSKKV